VRPAAVLLLAACHGADDTDPSAWDWGLPEGFPAPVVPDDNPMSEAKVELGRHLFYDTRLSGNQTQSCASCHDQTKSFTDGRAQAIGSTGEVHFRSAMGLANVGYFSTYTWASQSVRTLEQQALLPMFGEHPVELGLAGMEEELLLRYESDPEAVERFDAAFPGEPVALGSITKALSAFQRTMISGNSAYDRFIYQGDSTAMSAEARRGLALFQSERLECFHCHGGFLFSDSARSENTTFDEIYFHNTALYDLDGEGAYPESDQGLIAITGVPEDMGRFRAPSLRNVALTAPYMHDGSIATLEEVIAHYAAGGRAPSNPNKSLFMVGFELTEQEEADLLAFLMSLTDESFLVDPRFAAP